MTEEFEITTTSLSSANVSEQILKKTANTYTAFLPELVDNIHSSEKGVKGTIIFRKAHKINENEFAQNKLSRKSIHYNEYLEFTLDTEETFNLFEALKDLYSLPKTGFSPFSKSKFIKTDDETYQTVKAIVDNEYLISGLKKLAPEELEKLNFSINLANLIKVKELIANNLTEQKESFWQELFTENSWILSQVFSAPYLLFQNQPYVGGKNIGNSNGKHPDYLFKNNKTDNIAIIEIKTPTSDIVSKKEYRSNTYTISQELAGAVAQILTQKDTLYKHYTSIKDDTDENYYASNIKCILVIGNTDAIKDNKDKLKSFELFRNEQRSLEIITFDELLEKVELLISLFEQDSRDISF